MLLNNAIQDIDKLRGASDSPVETEGRSDESGKLINKKRMSSFVTINVKSISSLHLTDFEVNPVGGQRSTDWIDMVDLKRSREGQVRKQSIGQHKLSLMIIMGEQRMTGKRRKSGRKWQTVKTTAAKGFGTNPALLIPAGKEGLQTAHYMTSSLPYSGV